jgi:hypothetical protein
MAYIKVKDITSKPAAKERFNELFRLKNEYNVLMSVIAQSSEESESDYDKKVLESGGTLGVSRVYGRSSASF